MSFKKQMIFFLISCISANLAAQTTVGYTRPLLVEEMKNVREVPKNFRTSSDPMDTSSTVNLLGLKDLHIAGGAAFSALGLEAIKSRMPPNTHLTIIDLRQESHGLLNGEAISWYGPANTGNANKTPSQIEIDQAARLANIEKQPIVEVHKILQKSDREQILKVRTRSVKVQQVLSEEEIAKRAKVDYHRLYVADYHAPNPHEVDHFIEIVKNLKSNDWLYFHCRAGEGRTTTFMSVFDMMQNAKRVSFDDILARQSAMGGRDLSILPKADTFKYQWALDRYNFLKHFYEYAKANNDHFSTTWSQWLSQKK